MRRQLPSRRAAAAAHGLLVALIYAPILRTAPGTVGADTKTYLYLDPARLLSRAPSMWDPNVGMGTLTHQTIGYLFPMGPWYWLFETAGAPDWVAQRLWLATVMFAAGAGVLFLCRTLQWEGLGGPFVAALAYALSPYVLDYSARISVILLPWAALPWLIALADRALRRGGWRHPALFALVVLAVGGVNATALVFAGLGPVLWFPFAVWGTRSTTVGRAAATIGRIGVLTTAVSLWWVMGLAVQGRFGIPILRYTETVETVARTSLASEVLRGLGYWFFYGNDKLGPWIQPAVDYTQRVWLIAVGFAIPTLALAGAAIVRWRHRAYCICLIAVGVVIAVGAHPYNDPSPLGGAFKALANTSTVGLALRSTPRAVPLVALGMALLLGASLTALASRVPRAGAVAAVLVATIVVAGMPPLFTGDLAVGEHIKRPQDLPRYWEAAASFLDSRGDATRVLELPGTDFASYRWGNTIDPITPYLMDRPYVARELIPYGSPASADLLNAFDRRLQEGVFEPATLAPVARLMSAGDIVLRNDLQFERFRTPRPRAMWDELTPAPAGIGSPIAFGPAVPDLPTAVRAGVDEIALGVSAETPAPPSVAVLPVSGARPIVRAEPEAGGLIVAGDGEGLVELAAAGILDEGTIRYAASIQSPSDWDRALRSNPTLVLTDSNRLRGRRWGTVRENAGFTEQPGAGSLVVDATDARLDVFPGQDHASQTVAQQRGVRSIRASHYGNPVSFTPEDRASNAADGDLATAWRVGAFGDVRGERLRLEMATPTETDRITVVQPVSGPRNRYITRAKVRVNGGNAREIELTDASRSTAGQVITFPHTRVAAVEIEVVDTNFGVRAKYDGMSGVGIAELGIAGARVDEIIRLPTDLLTAAGERARDHALAVVLARQRTNPADPGRGDEEPTLKRTFALPGARQFLLRGDVRVAAGLADESIDRLLGATGPVARSDSRLPGDLASRASAAIDGDPTTAWQPGLLDQPGHWLEVEPAAAFTFDRLDLTIVADGRHSVPTRVRIDADGKVATYLDLPAIGDGTGPGSAVTLALPIDPITARTVRLTVEEVRSLSSGDFFTNSPVELPVGIAELGIAGVGATTPPGAIPSACRDDLIEVDGGAVSVRVTGDARAAAGREALAIELCDPAGHLTLGPGDHELRSAPGSGTGLDVDRLVLTSDGSIDHSNGAKPATRAPGVRVTASTPTSFDLQVEGSNESFWLVLGQSHNLGWHAVIEGADLGPPTLIDGFANGWLVDPTTKGGPRTIRLDWTPQRPVWVGLAMSALAVLLCLGIVLWTSRRRARPRPASAGNSMELALPPRPHPLGALAVGIAFGLAAGPVVGATAGGLALLAAFVPSARWILAFGPAAAVAAAGVYVAVQQWRYRYPPDFAWPLNTEGANSLGWLAVALLVATALQRNRNKKG